MMSIDTSMQQCNNNTHLPIVNAATLNMILSDMKFAPNSIALRGKVLLQNRNIPRCSQAKRDDLNQRTWHHSVAV